MPAINELLESHATDAVSWMPFGKKKDPEILIWLLNSLPLITIDRKIYKMVWTFEDFLNYPIPSTQVRKYIQRRTYSHNSSYYIKSQFEWHTRHFTEAKVD